MLNSLRILGRHIETASAFLREWRAGSRQPEFGPYLAVNGLIAVAYIFAGLLGLRTAHYDPAIAPVWPASGIALAAFLLFSTRVWPAILLGALCVNFRTTGSAEISLLLAAGNVAQGLLAAFLVEKFAAGERAFERAQSVIPFTVFGAFLSTAIGAAWTAGVLWRQGSSWETLHSVLVIRWLGDALGNLLVAPILLLTLAHPLPRWNRRKLNEALALISYLLLTGLLVFSDLIPSGAGKYPLEFLCVPFLIWAALRFSQSEAAFSLLLLAAISISGTLSGDGPFARPDGSSSLLVLQAFLVVMGIMTHIVAAVVAERHQVHEALKEARDELAEKAISDPLTGLANYRRFVDVFEAEADRSHRTGRVFSLVLFDLDDLKKLNDAHGHLTGTRALCRVGNTMRVYCRGIDTAVRYGGDEFALLLPETNAEGAFQVAKRIAEQVAGDQEFPPISVSFGIAVYPGDGRGIEEVFGRADRALYQMKARRALRQPQPGA